MWLLKRTFTDFETKLAALFADLKTTLEKQNQHGTDIKLLTHRVDQLEKQNDGPKAA